ncbi:enoyl-CoA hydratase-related protein [Streptosporangium lutulentum]|uniref:2-(1,2-epoxy-1,2-dihydrophenyl)acetyl-CoA isomerase n=1 Tax=Streptosporangium lutulentum TaxID=1461250 RepID=A0ABT9QQP2_9ACTN|nr:enoyl-CoA hydratase-related protein [Streptosporangium lutulentum]MDP9849075.1 2-(1,2-epoxy-1,2-dihydrophenyl)acetyl-CoA isomerase [Streptosporangium lutulentum]
MNDVLYSVDDAVATVTIDRPEAMNALTTRTKADLLEALTMASQDHAVRAVLLTGSGRAFCAGQDLNEHAANLEAGRGLNDTVRTHYNPIVRTIAEMGKPVVAAVNGVAAGAGAGLAFACDLRIASEKAKFAMAFGGIGLAPDSGTSWTLQRLVGLPRATELLLLGEPLDAARALELGIVSQVVPADELSATAHRLAVRLAQGPTSAYAATKRALEHAASSSLADALALEAELQDACVKTDDHLNATRSFLNKERPVFEGH